jgi:DNA primase large subunit
MIQSCFRTQVSFSMFVSCLFLFSCPQLDDSELNERVAHYGNFDPADADRPQPTRLDLLWTVPFADKQRVYYKVPFEDAMDLLKQRKVYLEGGFAYVSRANLSAIITTKFKVRLSQALSMTCRATAQIKQDTRIVPMLGMMAKQYITAAYKGTKIEGAVTKEQLPLLAERSFPLCMQNLYGALKSENHLKHGGRMQLGLFLKGIGLSLNDALAFWKQSFARRTPPEKFDKEYAYNIRHNYGKEGKRTTYTPYGCIKIIQSAPGAGDHHGCPFRQFEEANLKSKMRGKNFTNQQMEEVLSLVKGQHFQIACQRYYQFSHGNQSSDLVGNHPNAYFDASEQWFREQEANGAKPAAVGATTAGARSGPGVPAGGAASAAGQSAASASQEQAAVFSAFASTPASTSTPPVATPVSTATTQLAATPAATAETAATVTEQTAAVDAMEIEQ